MMIKITAEIVVRKAIHETFAFLANPGNDHLWRQEINESIVSGPIQLGVTVTEYSKLSVRKPNNKIVLTCIEFRENERVVFQSVENERFYVRSTREVQKKAAHETNVVYTLEFDPSIVKFALGFGLPAFLISFKAKGDMKKYLFKLKSILES